MLILTLTAFASAAEPDWDSLASTDGWKDLGTRSSDVGDVEVRSKYVDDVGCVEGRTVVSASPDSLVAVTRDMVSSIDWSTAAVALSEEVERTDADHFVLFQYYDSPGWTFSSDRYWVIRGVSAADEEGGSYRWQRVDAQTVFPAAHAKAMARSSGAVEPPTNYGEWQFEPTEQGTSVTYRACADIGGRVPGSIVQWLNTSQVPNLVADLVQEAERR